MSQDHNNFMQSVESLTTFPPLIH